MLLLDNVCFTFFYCWFIQLNVDIYGILSTDILHETTDYSGVIKNHQEILKKYPNEMIKRIKKKKKVLSLQPKL